MTRQSTNSISGKPKRLRNRLLSIVLVLAATLSSTACSDDEQSPTTNDPSQTAVTDEQGDETNPAAEDEREAERTVVRTDNPDDVKLATDVLMAFVTSEQVDARHFSVTVSEGVAHLVPTEDATEAEQREAATLAQSVDGIDSVDVSGSAGTHVVAENAQAVEEAVAAQDTAVEDSGPSAEEELEEAQAVAEPEDAPEPAEEAETDEEDGAEEEEAEEAAPRAASADYRSYTIKRGDTLSIVAARELGSGARWTEIYELNRRAIGPNPDGIRDGMVIRLPAE